MGYPDLTFRSELDPTTRKELELFASQLQGFLSSAGFGSDGTFNVNLQSAAVLNPTGMPCPWLSDDIPDGWLLCDGRQISKAVYPALWKVIKTLWGADTTTTFALPDGRGKLFIGAGSSGLVIGSTGGSFNHTHSSPNPAQPVSGSTAAGGGWDPTLTVTKDPVGSLAGSDVVTDVAIDGEGTHAHGAGSLQADSVADSTTGTANPPYFAGNWIIKT